MNVSTDTIRYNHQQFDNWALFKILIFNIYDNFPVIFAPFSVSTIKMIIPKINMNYPSAHSHPPPDETVVEQIFRQNILAKIRVIQNIQENEK